MRSRVTKFMVERRRFNRRATDSAICLDGLWVRGLDQEIARRTLAVNDDAFYPGGRLAFLAAQIIRCTVSVKTCAKQIISRSKSSNSVQNIKASLFSASLLFRLGFFAFLDPLSLCQFDHHPTLAGKGLRARGRWRPSALGRVVFHRPACCAVRQIRTRRLSSPQAGCLARRFKKNGRPVEWSPRRMVFRDWVTANLQGVQAFPPAHRRIEQRAVGAVRTRNGDRAWYGATARHPRCEPIPARSGN